jgi:hypothetical protein
MFLPYAVEDNIERKKPELNGTKSKTYQESVCRFSEHLFQVFQTKYIPLVKKCVLRVSIPTVFCCCVPRFVFKFCHISKVKN